MKETDHATTQVETQTPVHQPDQPAASSGDVVPPWKGDLKSGPTTESGDTERVEKGTEITGTAGTKKEEMTLGRKFKHVGPMIPPGTSTDEWRNMGNTSRLEASNNFRGLEGKPRWPKLRTTPERNSRPRREGSV